MNVVASALAFLGLLSAKAHFVNSEQLKEVYSSPSGSSLPSLLPSQKPSGSTFPSAEPSLTPSITYKEGLVEINPSGSSFPSSEPSLIPSLLIMDNTKEITKPSGSSIPSTYPSYFPSSVPSEESSDLIPKTDDDLERKVPCPAIPDDGCSVCGDGRCVTKPDALFAYPDQPSAPCRTLQAAGKAGILSSKQCSLLPPLINITCGCSDSITVTPSPTTLEPVSEAPVSPVQTSNPLSRTTNLVSSTEGVPSPSPASPASSPYRGMMRGEMGVMKAVIRDTVAMMMISETDKRRLHFN